ncbi:DMT family transporter [Wenxinia marina]|uniref:Putative permease, DMT superfamily n=1 Tax=Wenxinia marina DSM 24838 TaxID=1123501 RepID=A0A0D0PF59_9RHOB|nr:DMT family transporter [Wenxinia marina]KIQ70006.1 putative permease, DMT superfamily [Wenxinia marina DSM 24838]GGL62794.1 DMT transporter permease [Wenxinia marina]
MRPALLGPLSAALAVTAFSINDLCIKMMSGDYALHQVVLIRSTIGLAALLAVLVPTLGLAALRPNRPFMHLARGLCVVFANTCFFLGLAALPLAEGVALFFVSPLVIAVFSVIFLRETVGPWRWAAIALGLVGVVIVLRPGTEAFRPAALLPILAAFGYASLHMLTRRIGATESAAAMAVSIQTVFIVVSGVIGLSLGHGAFAGSGDPSIAFLLRGWVWPAAADWPVLALIGLASATGGYFIGQAYRLGEAALVAPFEYLAMPLAMIWGIAFFAEWPDGTALAGIALILGSGLFMIWREARARRPALPDAPRTRR